MRTFFRIIGFLEGGSYLLLLFIAVPLKYWGGDEKYVKVLGMPHGLLFVAYIALACLLRNSEKWNFKNFSIIILASILPFGTFYVDRKYLNN
jgi:integral membrane protein